MIHAFQTMRPRDFFLLKTRYQLLLLWLPVIAGGLSVGFGGYYFASIIAGHLGINPKIPVISQSHGPLFVLTAACVFPLAGIIGGAIVYVVSCVSLKFANSLSSQEFLTIFRGKAYPVEWFQVPARAGEF